MILESNIIIKSLYSRISKYKSEITYQMKFKKAKKSQNIVFFEKKTKK